MSETPPSLTSEEADECLGDVQIIDCDAHFTEPTDLWTSRVAKSKRDLVPQQQTVDGQTAWYLDGEMWATLGGNVIGQGGEKVFGKHYVQPFENIDPAAWDVTERLKIMDTMGIYAQVCYPNGIGFTSNHIFAIDDPTHRLLVLQTYNDFFADIQEESGGRLLPQALLPIWDMDLTVKEMTRLIERGISGFTLSDKPELLGLAELPDRYFTPMWDLASQAGLVMNFHIGSGMTKAEMEATRRIRSNPKAAVGSGSPLSAAWTSFTPNRRMVVASSQAMTSNIRVISNLLMSDMFDRFPNLKIVSAESGIGWVPFVLEALEYNLDEFVGAGEEWALTQRRPTEYFRDHIYVMFWFERVGPAKLIEDIGVNNVLVETDFPHPTCLYPDPRRHLASVLQRLDETTRRRVLQDNTVELYGIQLPTAVSSGL